MEQCVSVDASSSIKILTDACVPCHSWTVMLLVAVQHEKIDGETTKERVFDESDSGLSG